MSDTFGNIKFCQATPTGISQMATQKLIRFHKKKYKMKKKKEIKAKEGFFI